MKRRILLLSFIYLQDSKVAIRKCVLDYKSNYLMCNWKLKIENFSKADCSLCLFWLSFSSPFHNLSKGRCYQSENSNYLIFDFMFTEKISSDLIVSQLRRVKFEDFLLSERWKFINLRPLQLQFQNRPFVIGPIHLVCTIDKHTFS